MKPSSDIEIRVSPDEWRTEKRKVITGAFVSPGRRDAGTGWAERGSNARLQARRLGGAVIAVKSFDVRRLHSRDNFNGNTDRKTELAVRAPLIYGDFGQSVGILIPESRAWLPITERPRALQYPSRDGEPCGTRELGDPQAGHGIAEMIDVIDLAEFVRPARRKGRQQVYLAPSDAEPPSPDQCRGRAIRNP